MIDFQPVITDEPHVVLIASSTASSGLSLQVLQPGS